MSRHHKSNLGRFGEQLEVDLQGYTYTTVSEWLTVADLDYQTTRDINEDPEWAAEWATEQAAAACAALDAANAALQYRVGELIECNPRDLDQAVSMLLYGIPLAAGSEVFWQNLAEQLPSIAEQLRGFRAAFGRAGR